MGQGSGRGRRVATRGTAWHGNAATLSTVSEAPVGGVRGSGGQRDSMAREQRRCLNNPLMPFVFQATKATKVTECHREP